MNMKTIAWVLLLFGLLTGSARAAGQIDFVLVLDESGSMEYAPPKSDVTRLRVDSARLFVQLCGPDDRVGVIGFGEKVEHHTGPTLHGADPTWKHFVWQRLQAVSGLQAHTDMLGGLKAAMQLLDAQPKKADKTFIVFLTDGKVDGPRDLSEGILRHHQCDDLAQYKRKLESVSDSCGAKGYKLLCIGLGTGADGALLAEIANRGAGRYWPAKDATELQAIYSDIFINLADRFSMKAQNASPPIKVNIEPGLKEFVALAFPRDPSARKKPFLAGFKLKRADGTEVQPEISATKSWSAARLRDPEPGVWEVHFDPSLKVDILLVKFSGCRIKVNSPNLPEYPPGPVPINVQLTDRAGKAADVCAGEVEAELAGPGIAAGTIVKLIKIGVGQFAAPTPHLADEGEYMAVLKAYAPGGREFVNQRTITWRIKVQPARDLNVVIRRPDSPAYLAGGAVPIEVEVTAPDGAPLTAGQIQLKSHLRGPSGDLGAPNLVEESPGLFKGATPLLTAPGTYTVGVDATFGGDARSNKSATRDFIIQEAPPEQLTLKALAPAAGAYYPGILELKGRLTKGGGSPVGGGEAKVEVDLAGPGASQKITLSGNNAGIFAGQTPALATPGKYTANFRAQMNGDARSIATAKQEFEIRAASIAITDVRLQGEQPLFAGEPFEVTFNVKATGVSGTPKIEVVVTPPGIGAEPFTVQPEALPDGGFKVRHEPTTLGSGRVDITASAPSGGATPITSAVAVPLEALLDVRSYPHSVEAGTTTTYNIGLLSLFPDPANGGAEVALVAPAQGGSGAVPGLTPTTNSVPLTRPETTDDFTAFAFEVKPGDTFGDYKAELNVTIAGRYPDGQEFTRTKKITTTNFEVTRPPASPVFWLILLALAVAVYLMRPNFSGTWLKVNGDRVGIGERTGAFDTRVGVGGPNQHVVVVEEECTPVILRAGWMGTFRRETTEGSFELKSGDTFEVGRQQVKFIKGTEPKEKPAPPPGAPTGPMKPGALDDIA